MNLPKKKKKKNKINQKQEERKVRVEINKIENRKTIVKINETEDFFEKISKIDRLTKEKNEMTIIRSAIIEVM